MVLQINSTRVAAVLFIVSVYYSFLYTPFCGWTCVFIHEISLIEIVTLPVSLSVALLFRAWDRRYG